MERANQRGWNGTRNGERERPVRAGWAMGRGGRKDYVVRGCAGVLEVLRGGGILYVLGLIISETAVTAD